jgi:hypothetical protein
MTVSITCTNIRSVGGKHYISFGKTEYEFNDLEHLKRVVSEQLDRRVLAALFLKIAIERQPALSNPAQLEGRTLTINTDNNNFGVIS